MITSSPHSEPEAGLYEARRRVLRFIRVRGLEAGDRLPSHADLRRELDIGNNQLHAAMRCLVDEGVVTRKPRLGTVVQDTRAANVASFRIAILAWPDSANPYQLILESRLRRELCHLGYEDRTFVRRPDTETKRSYRSEDFVGLQDAIAADLVDLVIASRPFDDPEIPVCVISGLDRIAQGVRIDHGSFARGGVDRLWAAGCRRLCLITPTPVDEAGRRSLWRGFATALDRHGQTADPVTDAVVVRKPSIEAGTAMARELLARPRDQRPDGLVVADDHIACGLGLELERQGGYRPALVVQVNRHVEPPLPATAHRLVLDQEVLARLALEIVDERLTATADRPARSIRTYRFTDAAISGS